MMDLLKVFVFVFGDHFWGNCPRVLAMFKGFMFLSGLFEDKWYQKLYF